MASAQYLLLSCLIVAFILDKLLSRRGIWAKLPPGPRGFPILGNLPQVVFAKDFSKDGLGSWLASLVRYGEYTTLRMGHQTWIILNSSRVADQIINKRAAITNERPFFPIANKIVSRDSRVVLRHVDQWTRARKTIHPLLNGGIVAKYKSILERESLRLVRNCMQEPQKWHRHTFHYGYQTVHQIVAGTHSGHTESQLEHFQRCTIEFLLYINASLVDYFPILDRTPKFLQFWRSYWERIGADHAEALRAWCEPILRSVKDGTAPESFMGDLLTDHEYYSKNQEEALPIATSIVEAGSDNGRMATNIVIMAIMDQPEAAKKARAEIDGVCGANADRLPGIDDMERLPYVLAFVKECIRWRPNIPIAIIPQHRLTEDLDFEGYHFPAGTDFLVNSAAVSRECEDPLDFKPERWIESGQEHNIVAGMWSFGGGRRICVGYKIAQQEMFLAASRFIYCLDICGRGPYDSRQMRHDTQDEPFPVSMTPRSSKHAELISRLGAELSNGKA